MITENQVEKLE